MLLYSGGIHQEEIEAGILQACAPDHASRTERLAYRARAARAMTATPAERPAAPAATGTSVGLVMLPPAGVMETLEVVSQGTVDHEVLMGVATVVAGVGTVLTEPDMLAVEAGSVAEAGAEPAAAQRALAAGRTFSAGGLLVVMTFTRGLPISPQISSTYREQPADRRP